MRFALIATSAAAALAVPLAMAAVAPEMSRDQFLNAVRCTAYEDVTGVQGDLSLAKWRLNSEARRQPADATAEARAEVASITRQAERGAAVPGTCAETTADAGAETRSNV